MMNIENYSVKKVINRHPIEAEVPGSKSITNRALLLAALSEGHNELRNVLFSDDSRHFLEALERLGFQVHVNEKSRKVSIEGTKKGVPCALENKQIMYKGQLVNGAINVGSAGTAARFLTAYLGLSQGRFYVDSSEQMKKRPMKELLDALTELGANVEYMEEEFHFPFVIGNTGLKKDAVTIDVDKSSQFLSALLISSVLFEDDFVIHVTGEHGMAYVNMTCKMMKEFGAVVDRTLDGTYVIAKENSYTARNYDIEPDLSAACYFYAMSPLLGVPSMVRNVHLDSIQGDVQFLSVLTDMGCLLDDTDEGVVVLPPENSFNGGSWDLSSFSDQTLTLAAIAPYASTPVEICNVDHIRYQECDRMKAITTNLSHMNVRYEEIDKGIRIYPSEPTGCQIETFDDHRVAMSFSLTGLVTDNIVIQNPMCCRKTFENYFEELEKTVY